ncbi:MAG: hypothetical protein R3B48_28860 [Kofleriaceae bacterium]
MSIHSSLQALLTGEGDFVLLFDQVRSHGEAALPALAEAARQGRAIPQLTALLSALQLEDPVRALQPWLDCDDPLSDERSMALQALGARGDPRATKTLIDALPTDVIAAADALGDLGAPEAIGPLLEHARGYLGDRSPLEGSQLQDDDLCRELRIALTAITALAKLGSFQLAAVPIQLATLRDDEESGGAALVRQRAVDCLRYVAAPGVAQALRDAAMDPDEDTARAALRGMLLVGRKAEAVAWIEEIERGGPVAENALWCLERWAGVSLPHTRDRRAQARKARTWWHSVEGSFREDVVYHGGEPIDLAKLVRQLPDDPYDLRLDLKVRTGAPPILESLMGEPVPRSERAGVEGWWKANSERFPLGKLHLWGRTFEPEVVG